MSSAREDNWSSEAYQNAAAFVPKLATRIVGWLDPQPDDLILDLGCGDGVLTQQIAWHLTGSGYIHGTDASPSMIDTAQSSYSTTLKTQYSILDATKLIASPSFQTGSFTKVFSNAALHWILRSPSTRRSVFEGINIALAPGGKLAFEMGGMGNVAEMRAALLGAVAKRVGIDKAREADPWFFPDEKWMGDMLKETGFAVEKMESEYRPTEATSGGKGGDGVEGWVRLMGKGFLDAVGIEEREACVNEVVEMLKTVCESPSGWIGFGYVRLRVLATKI